MPRFTISRHTGAKEGDHYDLFLEHGETLRTWRLERPDFSEPQEATEIDPHRKDYLDYEGEISGNRGRVRIVETGEYVAADWTPALIVVELKGRGEPVRLRIEELDGKVRTWRVRRVPK